VLENRGGDPWRGAPYVRMQRLHHPAERSFTSVDSYSFTGPVLYDGETYEKLDVEDLSTDPVALTATGGWIAGIQHHFLAAAVPPADVPIQFEATVADNRWLLTALGQPQQVASDMQQAFAFT